MKMGQRIVSARPSPEGQVSTRSVRPILLHLFTERRKDSPQWRFEAIQQTTDPASYVLPEMLNYFSRNAKLTSRAETSRDLLSCWPFCVQRRQGLFGQPPNRQIPASRVRPLAMKSERKFVGSGECPEIPCLSIRAHRRSVSRIPTQRSCSS